VFVSMFISICAVALLALARPILASPVASELGVAAALGGRHKKIPPDPLGRRSPVPQEASPGSAPRLTVFPAWVHWLSPWGGNCGAPGGYGRPPATPVLILFSFSLLGYNTKIGWLMRSGTPGRSRGFALGSHPRVVGVVHIGE